MAEHYKGKGMDAMARVPLQGKHGHAKKPAKDLSASIDALEKLVGARERSIEQLKTQIAEQQRQNSWLSKQIGEITVFLEDYGLHWVGGPAPEFASFPNGPLDMELFMERIVELNRLGESSGQAIRGKGHVKTIAHLPTMSIVLLDDGFTVNGAELRPYSESRNGMFIQDIVDGFFPGEFKDRFPDGVKFACEDKRNGEVFKGSARRLIESARGKRGTEELGSGDGKLKIKMPTGADLLVAIEAKTNVRKIRRIVQGKLELDNFELCAPPSVEPVADSATMDALKLYPQGVLLVKLSGVTH